MKVTKVTEGILTTQDIKFVFDKEQDVPKKVYDYLKKTFPSQFKFEEVKEEPTAPVAKKEVVKEPEVEEKPKSTRGRTATK